MGAGCGFTEGVVGGGKRGRGQARPDMIRPDMITSTLLSTVYTIPSALCYITTKLDQDCDPFVQSKFPLLLLAVEISWYILNAANCALHYYFI
eukprot:832392-Rhodomonas_salina.1